MSDKSNYPKDPKEFFQQAFNRNIGLLTEDEQDQLRHKRVAVAGVGGVGGSHLMNLVRLGVGHFHIADLDTYELANIQRQRGAFMDTLGQPKAEIMRDMALNANPHLDIQSWSEGIRPDNVEAFLDGVDVFIDGIDFFSFETRRLLFRKCREKKIYAITAGPLGFGSAMLIFSPTGMSFDDYFDIRDNMDELARIVAFGVGLAPAAIQLRYLQLKNVDLLEKKGPSLVSACQLCGALAATEALKILLQRKKIHAAPGYFQMDPYEEIYKKGTLCCGNRHPWQRIKRWYLYKKFSKK